MSAGDKQHPLAGKAGRIGWRAKRPGIGDCHAVVFVQFALSAIVEQPVRRITTLLNFGKHDARADGVNGTGRDVDDLALGNRTPLDQFDDRTVPDRRPQVLRRYPRSANAGARFCRDDVPCALAFGIPIARA